MEKIINIKSKINKRIFILPNLIDTNKFKKKDSMHKIKKSTIKNISILIVARLEDKEGDFRIY